MRVAALLRSRLSGESRLERRRRFRAATVRERFAALLLITLLPLPTAMPQEVPAVKFSANAQLVVEIVTVKDKSGKPIEGLTAKDFTVTENGVAQSIAFCEYQKLDDVP